MKEFRGALISIGLALVLGVGWYATRNQEEVASDNTQLFEFEKHELIRVEIVRPDSSSLVLEEKDSNWSIKGTDYEVSRSMVNRIKHQIHDLSARALVDDNPDDLTRYGLGDKGIKVNLSLRSGESISFIAGDPNPTGVSYYIQPTPGKTVYTVKKSALDYYALDVDSFRERRFAYFNSKEAQQIEVRQSNGDDFTIKQTPDERWILTQPYEMGADRDLTRRLLGRVAALKARRFVEPNQSDYPAEMLNKTPLLDIKVQLQSTAEIQVRVYETIEEEKERLCWVQVDDEPSLYLAPAGIVDEYQLDLSTLRDRQVVGIKPEDIQNIQVSSVAVETHDPEGESSAVQLSGVWSWGDGVPVPGSTPSRLAGAIGNLKVIEFLEGERSEFQLSIDAAPIHIQIGEEPDDTHLYIGAKGESIVDDEGNTYERYTMALNDEPQVYLIDVHMRSVAHDFVREYQRRADNAAEQAERRERLSPQGEE